jgi:hypothetical protein
VTITHHGDTVGYAIPAHRKRSDADKAAFKEASARWQEVLDSDGVSEEEVIADFQQQRKKPTR